MRVELNNFSLISLNHALSAAREIDVDLGTDLDLIGSAFTQENVFTEFVRATEGVPRDAMYILSLAAQRADTAKISMPMIRTAAYNFIQSSRSLFPLFVWMFVYFSDWKKL